MTLLSIDLPDELKAKAEARAAEAGCESLEQYVTALIQVDADGPADEGAPGRLQFRSEEELEATLVKRLDDSAGDIDATPEFWRGLKERAHRAGEGSP